MKKHFMFRVVTFLTILSFIPSSFTFALPYEKQTSSKLRTEAIDERPADLEKLAGELRRPALLTIEEKAGQKGDLAILSDWVDKVARAGGKDEVINSAMALSAARLRSDRGDKARIISYDLGVGRGAYHYYSVMLRKWVVVLNSNPIYSAPAVQEEAKQHEYDEIWLQNRASALSQIGDDDIHFIASASEVIRYSEGGTKITPYHLVELQHMTSAERQKIVEETVAKRQRHQRVLDREDLPNRLSGYRRIDRQVISKYEDLFRETAKRINEEERRAVAAAVSPTVQLAPKVQSATPAAKGARGKEAGIIATATVAAGIGLLAVTGHLPGQGQKPQKPVAGSVAKPFSSKNHTAAGTSVVVTFPNRIVTISYDPTYSTIIKIRETDSFGSELFVYRFNTGTGTIEVTNSYMSGYSKGENLQSITPSDKRYNNLVETIRLLFGQMIDKTSNDPGNPGSSIAITTLRDHLFEPAVTKFSPQDSTATTITEYPNYFPTYPPSTTTTTVVQPFTGEHLDKYPASPATVTPKGGTKPAKKRSGTGAGGKEVPKGPVADAAKPIGRRTPTTNDALNALLDDNDQKKKKEFETAAKTAARYKDMWDIRVPIIYADFDPDIGASFYFKSDNLKTYVIVINTAEKYNPTNPFGVTPQAEYQDTREIYWLGWQKRNGKPIDEWKAHLVAAAETAYYFGATLKADAGNRFIYSNKPIALHAQQLADMSPAEREKIIKEDESERQAHHQVLAEYIAAGAEIDGSDDDSRLKEYQQYEANLRAEAKRLNDEEKARTAPAAPTAPALPTPPTAPSVTPAQDLFAYNRLTTAERALVDAMVKWAREVRHDLPPTRERPAGYLDVRKTAEFLAGLVLTINLPTDDLALLQQIGISYSADEANGFIADHPFNITAKVRESGLLGPQSPARAKKDQQAAPVPAVAQPTPAEQALLLMVERLNILRRASGYRDLKDRRDLANVAYWRQDLSDDPAVLEASVPYAEKIAKVAQDALSEGIDLSVMIFTTKSFQRLVNTDIPFGGAANAVAKAREIIIAHLKEIRAGSTIPADINTIPYWRSIFTQAGYPDLESVVMGIGDMDIMSIGSADNTYIDKVIAALQARSPARGAEGEGLPKYTGAGQPTIYEVIGRAQDLVGAGKYQEAISILMELSTDLQQAMESGDTDNLETKWENKVNEWRRAEGKEPLTDAVPLIETDLAIVEEAVAQMLLSVERLIANTTGSVPESPVAAPAVPMPTPPGTGAPIVAPITFADLPSYEQARIQVIAERIVARLDIIDESVRVEALNKVKEALAPVVLYPATNGLLGAKRQATNKLLEIMRPYFVNLRKADVAFVEIYVRQARLGCVAMPTDPNIVELVNPMADEITVLFGWPGTNGKAYEANLKNRLSNAYHQLSLAQRQVNGPDTAIRAVKASLIISLTNLVFSKKDAVSYVNQIEATLKGTPNGSIRKTEEAVIELPAVGYSELNPNETALIGPIVNRIIRRLPADKQVEARVDIEDLLAQAVRIRGHTISGLDKISNTLSTEQGIPLPLARSYVRQAYYKPVNIGTGTRAINIRQHLNPEITTQMVVEIKEAYPAILNDREPADAVAAIMKAVDSAYSDAATAGRRQIDTISRYFVELGIDEDSSRDYARQILATVTITPPNAPAPAAGPRVAPSTAPRPAGTPGIVGAMSTATSPSDTGSAADRPAAEGTRSAGAAKATMSPAKRMAKLTGNLKQLTSGRAGGIERYQKDTISGIALEIEGMLNEINTTQLITPEVVDALGAAVSYLQEQTNLGEAGRDAISNCLSAIGAIAESPEVPTESRDKAVELMRTFEPAEETHGRPVQDYMGDSAITSSGHPDTTLHPSAPYNREQELVPIDVMPSQFQPAVQLILSNSEVGHLRPVVTNLGSSIDCVTTIDIPNPSNKVEGFRISIKRNSGVQDVSDRVTCDIQGIIFSGNQTLEVVFPLASTDIGKQDELPALAQQALDTCTARPEWLQWVAAASAKSAVAQGGEEVAPAAPIAPIPTTPVADVQTEISPAVQAAARFLTAVSNWQQSADWTGINAPTAEEITSTTYVVNLPSNYSEKETLLAGLRQKLGEKAKIQVLIRPTGEEEKIAKDLADCQKLSNMLGVTFKQIDSINEELPSVAVRNISDSLRGRENTKYLFIAKEQDNPNYEESTFSAMEGLYGGLSVALVGKLKEGQVEPTNASAQIIRDYLEGKKKVIVVEPKPLSEEMGQQLMQELQDALKALRKA